MKTVLSENTKIAAYLLWENTKHNNALALWYCSEHIAYFFETKAITSMVALNEILDKPVYDIDYINFVRKISFFIYLSTGMNDKIINWFIAEKLLHDPEWCRAIVNMAYIFHIMREGKIDVFVRSDEIRRYLENKDADFKL